MVIQMAPLFECLVAVWANKVFFLQDEYLDGPSTLQPCLDNFCPFKWLPSLNVLLQYWQKKFSRMNTLMCLPSYNLVFMILWSFKRLPSLSVLLQYWQTKFFFSWMNTQMDLQPYNLVCIILWPFKWLPSLNVLLQY